jgi:hypothetical protein
MSATLFICLIHEIGDLFGNLAVVVDRALLDAVRAHDRVSSLVAAVAATSIVDLYGIDPVLCVYTLWLKLMCGGKCFHSLLVKSLAILIWAAMTYKRPGDPFVALSCPAV